MNLNKTKLSELRKMAEDQKIEGYEDMERKDLIEALTPKEEPKEEEKKGEKSEVSPEASEEKKALGIGIKVEHIPKGSKAERMLEVLSKQPTVRILIPLEGKEKPGLTVPFILNGLRLNVMQGVYVDVPEQIAEMIMKMQKQIGEALNNPLNLANPQHPKKQSGEGLKDIDA